MKELTESKISNRVYIILCVLLAGFIAAMFNMFGYHDHDYLWSYRLGEYVVQNKSIFHTDIWSWIGIEKGYVETAHSWLSDVLMYGIMCPFVSLGMSIYYASVAYSAVMGMLTFIVVYRLIFHDIRGFKYRPLYALYAFVIGFICAPPRTQSFSYILIYVLLYVIHRMIHSEQSISKRYYICFPCIAVLWANFHGGSLPMFFMILGFFIVLGFFRDFTLDKVSYDLMSRMRKLQLPLLIMGGISFVCSLINPYFIRLYWYFFFTNNADTKYGISEWTSTNTDSMLFIIVLIFVLAYIAINDKYRFVDLGFIVGFFVLGLFVSRFRNYVFIFGIYGFIETFNAAYDRYIGNVVKVENEASETLRLNAKLNDMMSYIILGAVFVIFLFMPCFGFMPLFKSDVMTDKDIAYVKDIGYKRMFNTYLIGSDLIYNGIPSFVDSRADLFENHEVVDCVDISKAEISYDDFKDKIDEYGFDAMCIEKGYDRLKSYLDVSHEWILDYDGDTVYVYRRNYD